MKTDITITMSILLKNDMNLIRYTNTKIINAAVPFSVHGKNAYMTIMFN